MVKFLPFFYPHFSYSEYGSTKVSYYCTRTYVANGYFRPKKTYIFGRPVFRACFVDAMKWAFTEGSQKPHRRLTEAPQNTPDFREIGLKNSQTFWYFWGLKEVLQSLVTSASARLTELCRGLWSLGRYAPDTPSKSRDFRKVLAYFLELSGGFWKVLGG